MQRIEFDEDMDDEADAAEEAEEAANADERDVIFEDIVQLVDRCRVCVFE